MSERRRSDETAGRAGRARQSRRHGPSTAAENVDPAIEDLLKVMTRDQLKYGVLNSLFTLQQEEVALAYLNDPSLAAHVTIKRQEEAEARLASGEDGAARTWGLGPQGSTAAALDAAFALQSANRRIEQVAAQFAHLPARTQPSRDQAHQDNVI